MISKVAEDIVWQKEHCDYPEMFPSLIAWEKKSCVYKGKQVQIYWATM